MRGGCATMDDIKKGQMKYKLFECISPQLYIELTQKVWYKIGNKIEALLKHNDINQYYGQAWTDTIIEKYLSKRARTVTEAIQLLVPGYASELSHEKIIEQFNVLSESGENDDVWWKDYAKFSYEANEVKTEKEEEKRRKDEVKKKDDEAKRMAEEAKRMAEEAKKRYDQSPEGIEANKQKEQAKMEATKQRMKADSETWKEYHAKHNTTLSPEILRHNFSSW